MKTFKFGITPDGQRVVMVSTGGLFKVFDSHSGEVLDLDTGTLVKTINRADSIEAVAITPDRQLVISVSRDYTLNVWDLHSETLVKTLSGHTGSVKAVAIIPDGLLIFSSVFLDDALNVWDLHSGVQVKTLIGHTHSVNAVAIAPDGQRAVSASLDHTLKVWDLESGTEIASFTAESALECCAFAPDGVTIVAGEASRRVHFLRLEGVARNGL